LSAAAFQAFEQGGFLAADIGARADPLLDIEFSPRTPAARAMAKALSKVAMPCGYSDRV